MSRRSAGFLFALVSFSASASLCRADPAPLPEVLLDRKSELPANFVALPDVGDGLKRYGFAFKTPNLVDGPATWRVVWDRAHPDDGIWEVTKPDGLLLGKFTGPTEDIAKHPDLAAGFPEGKRVQRIRVGNHLLVKATRYQAVLATSAETVPLGISINVAASGLGRPPGDKDVEMKVPDGEVPVRQVMELVENIRSFRGDEAALAFLKSQFLLKARRGDYGYLFSLVWNEAQFGSGKDDPAWSSRLNDAAFTSALETGRHPSAFEILNNLCARLGSAARFGRLAEVHAIFEDAYRRGGMNMDPSSYPDLGPAVPGLPAVRRRKIEMKTPYSVQPPAGVRMIGNMPAFDQKQAGALENYAYQRMNRGDWKGALEWAVWLRDWASDENGVPLQPRNETWYSANYDVAVHLEGLGFTEEALALADAAVAAPFGRNYRGRSKISASLLQLRLMRAAARPDPDELAKLRELVNVMENHIHFGKSSAWAAKRTLAEALFARGEFTEGEAIIEAIIREGSYDARWTRLDRWLAAGRIEGVEEELIALLGNTREVGHKISELGLYSRYADFLETAGRFDEALAMRREAIRLSRDFNAFTKLPVQLAKLAALLHKLGNAALAGEAADEARRLVNGGDLPPSAVSAVGKSLAGISSNTPTSAPAARAAEIDLQPLRGIVVPLAGAPWSAYLTLANPGAVGVQGALEISGKPMNTKADAESGDILVSLANAQGDGRAVLPLTLAPGSYRLITVSADEANAGEGELSFVWRPAPGVGGPEARLLIDKREQGVAGAVIQAGGYRSNPFYGVPIHFGYVATDRRATSTPLRFKSSQPARIEIHALDGTPLAVDGSGNGSLLDAGDEVFSATDGSGNLLLALENGAAALRILAYPKEQIQEAGLTVDVESLDGGEWSLHSSNRIEP